MKLNVLFVIAPVTVSLLCFGGAATLAAEPRALIDVDHAAISDVVDKPGARVTLVNVWATWCAPCVEEMPDLVRLHREHEAAGLRLVLISADFPEAREEAAEFLAEQGFDRPSYFKVGKDEAFIDALDEDWSGAMPSTFLFDAEGVRRRTWQGKVTYDLLDEAVRPYLKP